MMSAIVFDLWYTLIAPEDFRPRGAGSTSVIPHVMGFDPEHFKPYWVDRFEARMRGSQTLEQCIAEYVATLGKSMSEEDSVKFDAIWKHHDDALTRVRPDVLAGLAALRKAGVKLGLLSNVHAREVRSWPTSPLSDLFDAVTFSHEIRCAKPDLQAYAAILGQLGARASDAGFVGDGASRELVGAREAGFSTVVFMRGFAAEFGDVTQLEELASQADHTIDRIGELVDVLGLRP